MPVRGVRQIALTSRACALHADGAIACWGGRASGGDAGHPVTVDAPAKVTAIALGGQLCAILTDGTVACSRRQSGPPTRLATVPGVNDAISISAGSNGRSCAVTRTGEIDCWGRLAPPPVLNEDEDSIQRDVTRIVGVESAIAVAAGRVQDCAILPTGRVSCWSYDGKGQVQPAMVLPLEHVTALSSGSSLTCALTDAGEVYCWIDPYTANRGNATPIARVTGLKDATMLSVGANHACALVRGGSVRCWGRNTVAQLGSLHDLMQPGLPAEGGMAAYVVFGFAESSTH
jgi:alpha-tubulin suppressor-like RCC1 family protein